MPEEKDKTEYLKEGSTFNTNASGVKDELFMKNDFFDPRDIIQVKYEMLRKVNKENFSVKDAVNLFGMSRQYYYKLKYTFDHKGIGGLLPERRGPKGSFKVTDEITHFIEKTLKEDPTLNNKQIAQKIDAHFNVIIHPRTIERKRKGLKKSRGKR